MKWKFNLEQWFGSAWQWLRLHKKTIFLSTIAVLAVIIIVQLAYPRGRTLPFSRFEGLSVAFKDKAGLTAFLDQRYSAAPLTIQIGSGNIKKPLSQTGLKLDDTTIHHQLTSYPWWQRLIPFSVLVKPMFTDTSPRLAAQSEMFESFVKTVISSCEILPENAQISIRNGAAELTSAKPGRTCDASAVKQALLDSELDANMRITVPTKVTQPARSDNDVKPLLDQAKAILSRTYTLDLGTKKAVITKDTLGGWLLLKEDEATKQLNLTVDQDKLSEYVMAQEKLIYIEPGVTNVHLENGVETERTEGSPGRGLDKAETAKQIQATLLGEGDQTTITAKVVTLAPKVKIDRNYDNNQQGLDLLLADLVQEKGNYGIAVIELSGQKRISSANGDKRYITASIYKLFVAYGVIKQVEAGQMDWGQEILSGRNLAQCFDDMIVKSDNNCATTLGQKVGWKNIENMMHGLGLGNTFLVQAPTYDNFTTASDTAMFLAKLANGELFSNANQDRLVSAMRRQIYRSGIPAGVGYPVADKVGFLYGLLHDAGIVYSPHGTYVVVVLSDGSRWGDIADATARIDNLLSQ